MPAPECQTESRPPSDFAAVWRALPGKPLLGALLVVWVAFFHAQGNSTLGYIPSPSLFLWLENAWRHSADDQHGYFIPFAVLALLWWRRDEWLALPKRPWWPALALVALALAVHALGFVVQQTRFSVVGFFAGLWALTGLAWGAAWLRATFFPFVLFAFCVPLGAVSDSLTFPLRLLATNITVALSHTLLGVDVIQRGTALLDPAGRFQYEVAAACSGIRSLAAIAALALVYAFMEFRRPWKRCVVLLAAVPLAVAANVVRLLIIIIAADAFGQKAGNAAHENPWLSLLPYVPAVAGLFALGRWLREDAPPTAGGRESGG
jgi:exosortase